MSVILSKKAKCQGCLALSVEKKQFNCELGFEIKFETIDDIAISPVPAERCYKPRNAKDFREAKEKIRKV